jgi:hypothetical protein
LKIKLKGRHFDMIEVNEAEWQVVLSTLTEHDFQGTSPGNYGWFFVFMECLINKKMQ